jgi:hypothetical protein
MYRQIIAGKEYFSRDRDEITNPACDELYSTSGFVLGLEICNQTVLVGLSCQVYM